MKQISIRVADREFDHLKQYCELTERSHSDLFREFIRNLALKDKLKPLKDEK
jgi:hypothetical protein